MRGNCRKEHFDEPPGDPRALRFGMWRIETARQPSSRNGAWAATKISSSIARPRVRSMVAFASPATKLTHPASKGGLSDHLVAVP